MSRRVFSSKPIAPEEVVAIGDAEAHHLLHVLRVSPGDSLTLFDGRGGEFAGEVVATQRSAVEIRVSERQPVERELPFELTLGAPLPKGDRARWLVEKAVEAGVTRLAPLQTERTEGAAKGLDKLSRYVIEASKQCGRNRLMEITRSAAWADWLQAATTGRRWVAHPGGRPLRDLCGNSAAAAWLAVGPEGGFTEEEIAAATAAGWEIVDLGPRILRIETAAIAMCTAATWGGNG